MFLARPSHCTFGTTHFHLLLLIIAKDISHENILMNHHRKIPNYDLSVGGDQLPDFRSTFPVQYLFVDFGFASSSYLGPNSGLLMDPLPTGRPHRAPEWVQSKFDSYAADVYQTARLLYAWTHVCIALRASVRCWCLPVGNCSRNSWTSWAYARYELLQSKTAHIHVGSTFSLTRDTCWNSTSRDALRASRAGWLNISYDSHATLVMVARYGLALPVFIRTRIFCWVSSWTVSIPSNVDRSRTDQCHSVHLVIESVLSD